MAYTGESNPTMKEVAARAGVALSSVSRVLNNHPDVSDISNPLFADLTKGAGNRLQDAGYSVVLTNAESSPARDEDMIRLLRWRRVDGLITSLADEHRQGTIDELRRLEVPVVLLDRQVDALPEASVISADHAEGMMEATEHLLDLGHRRIALISGSRHIRPPEERLAGFKKAFRRHKIPYPKGLLRLGSFSPAFGEQVTKELLALPDPPTAIIAGGNLLLTGVLRALRSGGRKVGKDISLISCDDVALAELHSPPITVITRDTVRMGELAAELMLERLASSDAPARIVRVPTSLVVRKSTHRID